MAPVRDPWLALFESVMLGRGDESRRRAAQLGELELDREQVIVVQAHDDFKAHSMRRLAESYICGIL